MVVVLQINLINMTRICLENEGFVRGSSRLMVFYRFLPNEDFAKALAISFYFHHCSINLPGNKPLDGR